MENFYFIIILIIIIIFIKIIIYDDNEFILMNDYIYYEKFLQSDTITKLINNNKKKKNVNKKNKILFITYDNRYQEEYVKIHNYNINQYVDKWDYKYQFYNSCNKNVYWCKMFMVTDAIESNNYDYVIWLDSDTVIKKFDIDIGNILNNFSSDIFIGSDNNNHLDITNAGVFIVKNSKIGIDFLKDCIKELSNKCIKKDGSLRGSWAGSCYEQGVINILIDKKYYKYTTLLTNDIIFNYNVCSDEVFIMHLYASSPDYRVRCFKSNNPALDNSDNDNLK